MPGYDPYLELLGIPPDRRPPSHRELLGVGADETDVEKIEAAARKRHEYLGNYTISPQEEVAACAKRLLHEVGSALVALRNLLTSERPHEEAKAPAGGAMPPPLPPAVPVPPPVVTVAAGIPPTLEQAAAVGEAIPGDATVGDAAAAAGATSVPPGEPVFVEVATPEGAEVPELGGMPPAWTRGLARARGLFRGMAAGVRSIPRRLWGIVRWGDGLLRSIAGEENAILHGFLRAAAIAVLVPALAYAGLWLFWGLANLRATIAARGEGEASPGSGAVRIEASDPTAKAEVKVDGNTIGGAAIEEPTAPETGKEPPPAIAPFDAAKAQEHQRAWSKHLGVPAEAANSIGMKMVLIPAGEFLMGSSDGGADEYPPHRVRITKPFHLGQHEVTVGQFRQFVTESGYTGAGESWKTAFPSQTDQHPVVFVSWNDAAAFCKWLSKKDGKEYRLPTEAEWEYACRAGTQTKYSFGDDAGGLGEYGWFGGNSQLQTQPVGQKKPNAWGLYDVYGNVWEWCADWYDSAYYGDVGQVGNLPHAPPDDPVGPSSGAERAIRGGAWGCFATTTRSARRAGDQPGARRHDLGFRVASDVTPVPLRPRPAEIGSVKIELSDPAAKVVLKVDRKPVDSAKLSAAISLPAGEHHLEVASDGFEDYASSFTVRGGSQEVLRVALMAKPPPAPPPAIAPFDAAAARQHQETWSKHLGLPVETANSIGMKLVLIPPGEFMMGSPDSGDAPRPDERPQHRVRISKPLYLGQCEVTVGQFRQFVSDSRYTGAGDSWKTVFPSQTDEHPVVNVGWTDASAFCDWLSKKEAKEYRLPTEAEWEYACRAGSTTTYCFGDHEAGLAEYAWYGANSGGATHAAEQKKPNAWGLYDMHGNAWEWCADWYESGYYALSPADDPKGPSSGALRVLRGGSWRVGARNTGSAFRGWNMPDVRMVIFGFRAAREVTATPLAERSADSGTVRIELSDPAAKIKVKVDGNAVDSAKLDEGLVLPAGDHRLEVTSGQFEGYTSSFTVRAGRQEVLRIPLTPKLPLGPPLAVAPFDAAQARRHQESWGRHLGVPVETTNSAGMKFVLIPAGEFTMGSSDGRSDEKPPHKVRITKPFYLGQYEVTVRQFRQFVNESGYADAGERWETAFPSQTDAHPVVNVSWDAAKAFCDWLSKKEHKEYRLPTEAEWEYACRAGIAGKYCFGDDEAALGEYAWHSGNSGSQTHPVGQKKPNAWAFHDMHGNAWEWCADWYGSDYYASSPTDDPQGPSSGAVRVLRGGAWHSVARLSRSANRASDSPDCILHNNGFRVARDVARRLPPAPLELSGRVRIEVSDVAANVEVKVDGRTIDPAAINEPLTLAAGNHRLEVAADEFEDYTSSFTVRAGEEQVLRVSLKRKPLVPPLETNSIGMKMVLIPVGEFMMGSPDSDAEAQPDERPQHRVHINKSFYLGQYEVTVGQYRQFVQAARFRADTSWETAFRRQTGDRPVVNVSWHDADAFCKWLSAKEAKTYRLPTEAEWEYACRAGTLTKWSFGDDESELGNYAWFTGNSGRKTHPVGQKKPNAWGLYDMYGNVWEWCADWYESGYYAESPADNPRGPSSGTLRVLRGGSWSSWPYGPRSAIRFRDAPAYRYYYSGFRLARTP